MTFTFLLTVVGIALVDSLNPTATAIHIYLLSVARSLAPAVSYIAGKFATNYLAGYLTLLGLDAMLRDWLARIDPPHANIRLVLGLILIIAGFAMLRRKSASPPVKPRSLRPFSTFLLGVATTLAELPTAAPYWAAIALIAEARLNFEQTQVVLIIYNILFVLPLIVLCGAYWSLRGRGRTPFAKLERWISKWFPTILRFALIAIGVTLIAYAALHHLGAGLFKNTR